MVKSVKIINYENRVLIMELRNPEKSGFLLVDMTGIGPEKAEIRTTDIVTTDGSVYNSARLPTRNIVMRIRFFSDKMKTAEQIRHESYRHFPIKKKITLIVETDERTAEIQGYVESNVPIIFSKEVWTQLSIVCPYPYFYDGGPNGTTVTTFYGITPQFEFPFSNEDVIDPLILFGEIKNRSTEVIYYGGDSEIGITMYIDAIGPIENLTIYNVTTREKMTINHDRLVQVLGTGISGGDQIIIDTTRGNKSVLMLRNGRYSNILNALDRGSAWFQLTNGDNIFAFDAEIGAVNAMFRIENRTIYEGV